MKYFLFLAVLLISACASAPLEKCHCDSSKAQPISAGPYKDH